MSSELQILKQIRQKALDYAVKANSYGTRAVFKAGKFKDRNYATAVSRLSRQGASR